MNIAEQIIFNYYDIRNKIKDHRGQFQKKRCYDLQSKIYHGITGEQRTYNSNRTMGEISVNRKYLELQKELMVTILEQVSSFFGKKITGN